MKKFLMKLFRIKPEVIEKIIIKEVVIYKTLDGNVDTDIFVDGDVVVSGSLKATGNIVAFVDNEK